MRGMYVPSVDSSSTLDEFYIHISLPLKLKQGQNQNGKG
jgi:hypothetical protein